MERQVDPEVAAIVMAYGFLVSAMNAATPQDAPAGCGPLELAAWSDGYDTAVCNPDLTLAASLLLAVLLEHELDHGTALAVFTRYAHQVREQGGPDDA